MTSFTYKVLFEKSDLVAIATPIERTKDTKEIFDLPNIFSSDKNGNAVKVKAIGVETKFKVALVFKGKDPGENINLHHYRLKDSGDLILDGPALVLFDFKNVSRRSSQLLFLMKENDGRYAPTGGQTDPGYKAISELPVDSDRDLLVLLNKIPTK